MAFSLCHWPFTYSTTAFKRKNMHDDTPAEFGVLGRPQEEDDV